MNATTREQVRTLLENRRAEIVERWYEAISRTAFTPLRAADVRAHLSVLTDRVIDALLAQPFAREQARAVGAALADLHFIRAEALEGTLETLGLELARGLPSRQLKAIRPTLAALLSAIAAGFFARARAVILEEQERVRQALLLAQRQAEEAHQARVVAEATVRARNEIMSLAAHDLRSPLTGIMGYVDMMRRRLARETPPLEWLRARADAIHANGRRMQAIIEELLDASRLQMGQALELRLEMVDLAALAREVAEARNSVAAQGLSRVIVEAPETLPLRADRARLARVLENIVGNAVKYSPAATPVYVSVAPLPDGARVDVRDSGVGIPAEEMPRVFTPYFRASTAQTRPGIGLGLAGAKSIVEQHGGQIAIESAIGLGTTVTITLPDAPPEESATSL